MSRNKLAAMILTGLMAASPFASAQASDAEWALSLYGWLPTVGVDANTNIPPGGVSTTVNFSNLVDSINGLFLGHAEVQGERFGAFGDILYLGIGKTRNFDLFTSDTQIDSGIYELAAVWNVEPERFDGFDVFAGMRYFDVSLDLELDPVNPAFPNVRLDGSDSYLDFMLGARYFGQLSDRWGYMLRADGSWGDTDGSMNLSANLTYKTNSGAWAFGYRYMDVSLPQTHKSLNAADPDLALDLSLSGPVFSYTWLIK